MAHREGGGPHPYRSVECGRSDPVIHSAPLSNNRRRYSGARDDSREISAIKNLDHEEKRCRAAAGTIRIWNLYRLEAGY